MGKCLASLENCPTSPGNMISITMVIFCISFTNARRLLRTHILIVILNYKPWHIPLIYRCPKKKRGTWGRQTLNHMTCGGCDAVGTVHSYLLQGIANYSYLTWFNYRMYLATGVLHCAGHVELVGVKLYVIHNIYGSGCGMGPLEAQKATINVLLIDNPFKHANHMHACSVTCK